MSVILIITFIFAIVKIITQGDNPDKIVLSKQKDNTGREYLNSGEFYALLNRNIDPENKDEKRLKELFLHAPGIYPYFWHSRDFLRTLSSCGHSLIFSEEEGGVILNFSHRLVLSELNLLTVLPDGRLLVFRFDPSRKLLSPFLINPDVFPKNKGIGQVEDIDLTRNEGRVRPVGQIELLPGSNTPSRLNIKTGTTLNYLWLVLPVQILDQYDVLITKFWLSGINLDTGEVSTVELPWLDGEVVDLSRSLPCIAAGTPDEVTVTGINCPIFLSNQKGELLGRQEA